MILSVLSEQFYLFGRKVFFRINVKEPAERYAERSHDKDYVVNPIYIAEMQRFCKGKTEKSDNRPDKSDNVREPLFRLAKGAQEPFANSHARVAKQQFRAAY